MSAKPASSYGTGNETAATPLRPTTFQPPQMAARATEFLAVRRPWREFLDVHSVSLPFSYGEAMIRIRKNLDHFRGNYTLIMLGILFLSLLWHPISLIVFIVVFIGWYFFYFSREETLVVMNHRIDDRVVLIGLTVVTIVGLVFTDVAWNVFGSLLIAVAVSGTHAAFRNSDDLYVDEESATQGGMFSVVGSQSMRTPPYTRI